MAIRSDIRPLPRPSPLNTSGQQRRTPTEKTFVVCARSRMCYVLCSIWGSILSQNSCFIPTIHTFTYLQNMQIHLPFNKIRYWPLLGSVFLPGFDASPAYNSVYSGCWWLMCSYRSSSVQSTRSNAHGNSTQGGGRRWIVRHCFLALVHWFFKRQALVQR